MLHPSKGENSDVVTLVKATGVFESVMVKHFDATNYFESVNREMCLSVLEDLGYDDPAKMFGHLNKAELVKFATSQARNRGWLPMELRCEWNRE